MKLSVQDAARFLELPESKIYKWIKDGSLPAHKHNELFWLNRAELLEWATTRGIHVSPSIFEDPDTEPEEGGGVADAIERGGVRYDVPGATKDDVLAAVVAGLQVPEGVDPELLLHMLRAREAIGSTSVGEGIAFPHVRRPIVLPVDEPVVSLAFLARPVDFDAYDKQPVSVLFTLITPTVRSHLRMLSRIAHLLHDRAFRDALKAKAPAETLLRLARETETRVEPR